MRLDPRSFAFTVILGGLAALPPLSIDMGLPALPALQSAFSDAAGRGALTLSLFLAGFALSPLIAGAVADGVGRRPVMLSGLVLFVLSALGSAAAPSFPILLACRLAQGASAGACVIMPLAVMRDVFDGAEARARFSQMLAVMGVAPMLAPILGSWVMAFGDWRAIYAVQALIGAAVVVGLLFGMPETLPPTARHSLRPIQIVMGYRTVLGVPTFRRFCLVVVCGFSCLFAYISGAPAVFIEEMGFGEQAFSLIFAVTSTGMLVGSAASTALNRRNVRLLPVLTGCLAAIGVACLGAFVLALSGLALSGWAGAAAVVAAMCVMTVCTGILLPNASSAALQPVPGLAGAASGLMQSAQMAAGAGISAVLVAALPLGPAVVVTSGLMGACALCGAAAFFLLARRGG